MSPPICVIFNPAAGRRRGRRRLEQLCRQWGNQTELMPSRCPGHAEELAQQAVRSGFGIVAAAGGDGTVHEVANGVLRAGRPDVLFTIIPLGSANDYVASLDWEFAHAPSGSGEARSETGDCEPKSPADVRALDVGRVRSPDGRERYFVCCLGLGLNGAVTLEARQIKGLRGTALYGLATLRALWRHYGCPAMEVSMDEQPACRMPTLMLSVLVGRREGNFVMAPRARLDDGWFDFVQAGALSRWEVLKLLPRLALYGPPSDYPQVRQGRCRHLRLLSERPLITHIDGEFFCIPDDNVREVEVDILPGALRVLKTPAALARKR